MVHHYLVKSSQIHSSTSSDCGAEIAGDLGRVEAELPADPVRTELASTHQPTNGARGHGQLLGDLSHGQQRPWVRMDRSTALLPRQGISPRAGRCGAARGHGAHEARPCVSDGERWSWTPPTA